MKKAIIVTLIIIVAAVVLSYIWSSEKKESAKITQVTNEYPYMSLILADGSIRTARELPNKSILIFFEPDCHRCQREAREISNHLKSFESHPVWFISSAPYTDIEEFAEKYNLSGHANIQFAHTETQEVVNNFGGIPAPSVYIYSSEKKLVKVFNGEASIEEIIKHL